MWLFNILYSVVVPLSDLMQRIGLDCSIYLIWTFSTHVSSREGNQCVRWRMFDGCTFALLTLFHIFAYLFFPESSILNLAWLSLDYLFSFNFYWFFTKSLHLLFIYELELLLTSLFSDRCVIVSVCVGVENPHISPINLYM